MRQSISTRYIGPTNTRGSRVKATASGGISKTFGWDDAQGPEGNHRDAACALAGKLGWAGRWIGGGTREGYVFVMDDGDEGSTFTIEA